MSRMALVGLAVALMAGPAGAELCDLRGDETAALRTADFLGNWRDDYLDCYRKTASARAHPFWGVSSGWDTGALRAGAGAVDADRWWYVYLDRGRYRFLDVTQYTLLDGPAGLRWRWRYRAWLDAVHLSWSAPARPARDVEWVIPEPGSATLLALGALVALRRRRHNFL